MIKNVLSLQFSPFCRPTEINSISTNDFYQLKNELERSQEKIRQLQRKSKERTKVLKNLKQKVDRQTKTIGKLHARISSLISSLIK